MTEVARYLNADPEHDSPIVSVVFRPHGDKLQMIVQRADRTVSGSESFEDVGAMLGRLRAVAEGWHLVPPEQLEQMSKLAAITERDTLARMG